MAACIARVRYGRIELIIRKSDAGYEDFAKVLNNIEKDGCMSWYGDVVDTEGKEQCGLVITAKSAVTAKTKEQTQDKGHKDG